MKRIRLARSERYSESIQASLKDRFNYASFSCAALILSSSKDALYSSSVLNTNKDQYMLSPCPINPSTRHLDTLPLSPFSYDYDHDQDLTNFELVMSHSSPSSYYLTIELCSDIKMDTIVISNHEYFSSTFRHFSLWISPSYPPKQHSKSTSLDEFEAWLDEESSDGNPFDTLGSDKKPALKKESLYKNGWRLLGFFEAENTRGPQVSLIYLPFTIAGIYGVYRFSGFRITNLFLDISNWKSTVIMEMRSIAPSRLLKFTEAR